MQDKTKNGRKLDMYGQPVKRKGFQKPDELFKEFDIFQGTQYVTKEFQDFGYRLALQLDDLKHKSLYMKLAKTEDRRLLEQALQFTADYPKAQSKGRIFMWKLKELKAGKKDVQENASQPKTPEQS